MGSLEPLAIGLHGGNASLVFSGGVLQAGVGVATAVHRSFRVVFRFVFGKPYLHFWPTPVFVGLLFLSENRKGDFQRPDHLVRSSLGLVGGILLQPDHAFGPRCLGVFPRGIENHLVCIHHFCFIGSGAVVCASSGDGSVIR